MRRSLPALALALAACAAPSPRPPEPTLPTARAVQLARVRCLLVAPLENASDDPLVSEAATGALVSAIDANRTRTYPIDELRALFKNTSLELPDGVSASLALELGELVAADAVLYGSVEGRSRGPEAEVLLTLRLAATGVRDTLFWRSVRVVTRERESLADAARRAALEAAEPILDRIGVPGRKVCFDRQRLDRVRLLALAGEKPPTAPKAVAPAASPEPRPPPPPIAATTPPPASTAATAAAAAGTKAVAPPAPLDVEIVSAPNVASALRARAEAGGRDAAGAPAPVPAKLDAPHLTPRQSRWAASLSARQRFVVEGVVFAGRSPRFEQQAGLADLAAALAATPAARIRIEGFVDAGKSPKDDLRVSMELARAAGRRLVELGVRRDRVTWAGRGSEAQIAPSFTGRGRAANRRVEVVVQ